MGEADSKAGQLLATYLLHTVQDPFCTATQFSFENSFHTPLFVFLVDQILASQIKAVEETLWAKLTPLQVSHYSPISYTQFKIRSVQQDSPVSKQFSHSFLCFLVD